MHIYICMYCSILFLDSQHLYVSARHPNTYHVNFSKCPCRLPADWPWTGLISQVSVDKNTSPKMNRKDSLRHVFGYEVEFPKIGREIHNLLGPVCFARFKYIYSYPFSRIIPPENQRSFEAPGSPAIVGTPGPSTAAISKKQVPGAFKIPVNIGEHLG